MKKEDVQVDILDINIWSKGESYPFPNIMEIDLDHPFAPMAIKVFSLRNTLPPIILNLSHKVDKKLAYRFEIPYGINRHSIKTFIEKLLDGDSLYRLQDGFKINEKLHGELNEDAQKALDEIERQIEDWDLEPEDYNKEEEEDDGDADSGKRESETSESV
jgi:hypothetical protein